MILDAYEGLEITKGHNLVFDTRVLGFWKWPQECAHPVSNRRNP